MRIGQWGIQISMLKTRMGTEQEVMCSLTESAVSTQETFWWTPGEYDIVSLFQFSSLDERHFHKPSAKVVIGNSFSCFPWDEGRVSRPLSEWLQSTDVLLLVLMKIDPRLIRSFGVTADEAVAEHLVRVFGERFGKDRLNLFLNLGHCEVVLLLRCDRVDDALRSVTELRQGRAGEVLGETFRLGEGREDVPVFINTSSWPLFSWRFISGEGNRETCGDISARLHLLTAPGAEGSVASLAPSSASRTLNVYGIDDLVVEWDGVHDIGHIVTDILKARRDWGATDGVLSARCQLVGGEVVEAGSGSADGTQVCPTAEITAQAWHALSEARVDTSVRLETEALLANLDSLLHNSYLAPYVEDLSGAPYHVWSILDTYKDASRDTLGQTRAEIALITYIDLSREAIHQRLSGSETRTNQSSSVPFPIIGGIDRIIAAASSVPSFIYRQLDPSKAARETWGGFVLFGESATSQVLEGEILSLPFRALYDPIGHWWGMTHEVAHTIWRDARDEVEKEIPFEQLVHEAEQVGLVHAGPLRRLFEEVFAGWFDYRFFFRSDLDLYLPIIWESWLRVPRVWDLRPEYMARTLAIALSRELPAVRNAMDSPAAMSSFFMSKVQELVERLQRDVHGYDRFATFGQGDLGFIIGAASLMVPFIQILEKRVFSEDLYDRLNPDYSRLQEHSQAILDGHVVPCGIVDPKALLLELRRLRPDGPPGIPASVACILSLWNHQFQTSGDGAK